MRREEKKRNRRRDETKRKQERREEEEKGREVEREGQVKKEKKELRVFQRGKLERIKVQQGRIRYFEKKGEDDSDSLGMKRQIKL